MSSICMLQFLIHTHPSVCSENKKRVCETLNEVHNVICPLDNFSNYFVAGGSRTKDMGMGTKSLPASY